MSQVCQSCHARYFPKEKGSFRFTTCCYSGKVTLQFPVDPPQLLMDLYNGTSPYSRNFLSHIRSYNSSLAFAPMNCKLDHRLIERFPCCFRIHGQVYYAVSSIHPPSHCRPTFCQIYIFDSERANLERGEQARMFNLDDQLLILLHQTMVEHNPLASCSIRWLSREF